MAKIAVLFHKGTRNPAVYKVHYLAEFWREDGHDVVYLYGTRRFVPADILLVHVDLSVVPSEYLRFAQRYPVVLNGQLADIRKSHLSMSLLGPNDPWTGPVIVKTDLNFGGDPERRLAPTVAERIFWKLAEYAERCGPIPASLARRSGYPVFRGIAEVPTRWFSRRDVVVEKFLPEMEEGLYHVRICQVLGDRCICSRLASRDPMVRGHNRISAVEIERHPVVDRWRRELGLDYGKIDYVMSGAEPVLLDVNKTIGTFIRQGAPEPERRRRRYLAEGIRSFLAR